MQILSTDFTDYTDSEKTGAGRVAPAAATGGARGTNGRQQFISLACSRAPPVTVLRPPVCWRSARASGICPCNPCNLWTNMILVGTSGVRYPEWKGVSTHQICQQQRCSPYYASKFPTVEINYTFYRMPTPKLIAGWRAQVPPEFRFTLKAPKRITHDKRLRPAEVTESVSGFITAASELGPQMAALLFQLPPNFKKDVGLLRNSSRCCRQRRRRHSSSGTRHGSRTMCSRRCARNIALCFADSETRETPRAHGGLRIFPAARRRLWRCRHRQMDRRRETGRYLRKDVRVLQTRRRGERRRVRTAHDGVAGKTMTISDRRLRIADRLLIAGCVMALAGCNQTRVAEAPTMRRRPSMSSS